MGRHRAARYLVLILISSLLAFQNCTDWKAAPAASAGAASSTLAPAQVSWGLARIVDGTFESGNFLAASGQYVPFPNNAGFKTVYTMKLSLKAKDVVVLHGQLNFTSDDPAVPVVRFHSQMYVNGQIIGVPSAEDCDFNASHHATLWNQFNYLVPADGDYLFELRGAASGGSSQATAISPSGSRFFAEVHEAVPAGQSASSNLNYLVDWTWTQTELASAYGVQAPFVYTPVYGARFNLNAGDLVILSTQTKSAWRARSASNTLDMAGQGLLNSSQDWDAMKQAGTAPELTSPIFATRNVPQDEVTTPMWLSAFYHSKQTGVMNFYSSLHGVNGLGNLVVAGGGHLLALRFASASTGSAAKPLLDAQNFATFSDQLINVGANSWTTIAQGELMTSAGDMVLAEGATNIQTPATSTISCATRLTFSNASETLVSGLASRNLVARVPLMPMRNEALFQPSAAGSFRAELQVKCNSGGFQVLGDHTYLSLSKYGQVGPQP